MAPDRLASLSHRMAALTLWLVFALLALNAATWFFPRLASIEGGYGFAFSLSNALISSLNPDLNAFPWWQTAGAILLSSIPLIALSYGLLSLRSLFRNYAAGDYFSVSSSSYMEKMGWSVAFWVILGVLCEPLLSIWMTIREPVGQRLMSVSFGSPDVIAFFWVACIIVIARILRRASEINAENQEFI